MLAPGEIIRCDFSRDPNISRWLGNVKGLKSWNRVNEPFYGLLGAFKEMKFDAI